MVDKIYLQTKHRYINSILVYRLLVYIDYVARLIHTFIEPMFKLVDLVSVWLVFPFGGILTSVHPHIPYESIHALSL